MRDITIEPPTPSPTASICGPDDSIPFVTTLALAEADPFRLLVQAVQDYGIVMIDPAGRIVSWNPGAEKFKGYKASEIIGEHFSCFYTPEDVEAEKPLRGLRIALEQGRFEEEALRVRKGGEQFWAVVTITNIHDSFGNHVGFAYVTRDITERRRHEEMLRDAEVRMRSIVDHLIDGIITIDEDGAVVSYNGSAEKMFGYATDEVIGKNVRLLIPESFNGELHSYLASNMRCGETEVIGSNGEVVGRRKDGSSFPMEFAVSAFHIAMRVHFTGIVRDLSERKRHEEARRALEIERAISGDMLKRNEEQFRNLTANIDQVLWMMDIERREITFVSQGYEKMFGRSCQSLLESPRSYMEGMHPLDQELIERSNAEMFKTGHIDVEVRVLHPGGDVRWIWIKGNPVTEQNQIVAVVGVIEDVTQRRQLAEERENLLSRLRLHIDRMPLGYVLFDSNMHITDWNPSAERIFGFSKAEMLGTAPPYAKIVPRSFKPEADVLLQRIRAGDMNAHAINENLTKDGRTITCQWFNTPLNDADGEFVGILSLTQDITARKNLENQVQLAQSRLRNVVMSSPAVLFTLAIVDDQIYGISWISENLEEIFGYPAQVALGPHWWVANIHAEDRDRIIKETQDELLSHGRTTHEYRFRHGDGTYRWTRGDLRLVRYGINEAVEVVGAWTDITERKRLERQSVQNLKLEAIGRLAGGVAHDFNNLLTVINGFAEMAVNRLSADDAVRKMLEQVVAAGIRAAGLTRQLLAFSRKAMSVPKILDLKAIVAEVEQMLRRVIGDDIEMIVVSDADVGAVKADSGQIEQVIMNLVINARDSMPKGGSITIEIRNTMLDDDYVRVHPDARVGPHVVLAISDTGCGIDESAMAMIFEPFFSTKGDLGTGLGLATVHGIVKQSGGHISVYSEIGHGTTFKVYLPRVVEPQAPEAPPVEPEVQSRGTEILLFVEDQEAVRQLGQEVLRDFGYTVFSARDGIDALQVAEQQGHIDLLVTDVVMPRMGGREIAGRLAITHPNTKVLFLSGYTDDTVVRHGILEARVAFLQKPFTSTSLTRKVREVLDNKIEGQT
jgi:two-component system, cell cycle sensor histidine kinase and response regulator CckA